MKDANDTPLSKACQISVDTTVLILALDDIWELIENGLKQYRWTERTETIEILLSTCMNDSIDLLITIVNKSQDLIFEILTYKIDDLLSSLVFIDFEPEKKPVEAHECIDQLVDYLQTTFMWLTYLPKTIREAVHFTCCTKISNSILSFLLSTKKCKKINFFCIAGVELDCKKLIQFADNTNVLHLKHCFEELHEVVKAVLHPDLLHFSENKSLRKSLFPSLNPSKLAIILEKVSYKYK
jgi:hypothetical protein